MFSQFVAFICFHSYFEFSVCCFHSQSSGYANGCAFQGKGDSSEIDDLTEEWRARLWPGDLCLYDQPCAGAQKLKLAQVPCWVLRHATWGLTWKSDELIELFVLLTNASQLARMQHIIIRQMETNYSTCPARLHLLTNTCTKEL